MSGTLVPGPPGGEARSSRGRWALIVLVLAAAAGASSAAPWVHWWGRNALGDFSMTVSGASAAPVLPATALVVAAAGAALALAGRLGRWVVVGVVALGGLAFAVTAATVIVDPWNHARAAVASATGIDHAADSAEATVWPWVGVLVGVLVVVAAVGLARASSRWAAPSRRHEVAPGAGASAAPEARTTAPEPDERSDWDALTHGTDPSEEGT